MQRIIIHGAELSAEEVAAAMAAIVCLLQAEAAFGAAAPLVEALAGWRGASRLAIQGLALARPPVAPTWGRVERLRRAGPGGHGIVGL